MQVQQNYDFRKELLKKQKDNLLDPKFQPTVDMVKITNGYTIVTPKTAGDVLLIGAQDLQEYLFTSMKVSVSLISTKDTAALPKNSILVGTYQQLGKAWEQKDTAASYEITIEEGNIVICGIDERGCAQGCYWLEDQMTSVRAPYLKVGKQYYAPAFSPRMIHSGYGIDQFPDAHLSQIAHAGMDAILVFVKDVNKTSAGYLDFNELIHRAAKYGLDVYAYSYYKSDMHPDEEGAFDHYNSTYGNLFKQCPGFKGVVLVGESVEFPSKDPRVSPFKHYNNTIDGLPTGKRTAGWFPCVDYCKWIEMLKKVVYQHKPDADIVFWTYNWGWAPEEDRLKLIDSLPTDISLMVTFEMFEVKPLEDIKVRAADYTLSFQEPGSYFLSEAKRAKERGIRLYSQANSGGVTWDLGVIPYEPFPEKWANRYKYMLEAREKYGLCGIMESHHFGFWPSFISRIEKMMFTEPFVSGEEAIRVMAEELYGKENLDQALKAWHLISNALDYYTCSSNDQYGPFRIGPSYPLILGHNVKIPSAPYAHFGSGICTPDYGAGYDTGRGSGMLIQQRLPGEIRCNSKMRDLLVEGRGELEALAGKLEGLRKEDTLRLINLIRFIENTVTTAIHVKEWSIRKWKLHALTDSAELLKLVEDMIEIAKAEIENAKDTIPLVAADSRLGWEPSMEYMTDVWHIEWKIKQVTQVLEWELSAFKELFEKQLAEQ